MGGSLRWLIEGRLWYNRILPNICANWCCVSEWLPNSRMSWRWRLGLYCWNNSNASLNSWVVSLTLISFFNPSVNRQRLQQTRFLNPIPMLNLSTVLREYRFSLLKARTPVTVRLSSLQRSTEWMELHKRMRNARSRSYDHYPVIGLLAYEWQMVLYL